MSKVVAREVGHLILTSILVMLLGVIAIAAPVVAGKAVVIVIGAVLTLVGLIQLILALRAESWSDKALPVVLGIITAAAGIGVLCHPLYGLKILTLLIAVFFVVEGIWKIIASFSFRPAAGWSALLVSGLLTLLLGALIWIQWPISGVWAVGILVGVDLLMTGASMLVVALTVRRLNQVMTD